MENIFPRKNCSLGNVKPLCFFYKLEQSEQETTRTESYVSVTKFEKGRKKKLT